MWVYDDFGVNYITVDIYIIDLYIHRITILYDILIKIYSRYLTNLIIIIIINIDKMKPNCRLVLDLLHGPAHFGLQLQIFAGFV